MSSPNGRLSVPTGVPVMQPNRVYFALSLTNFQMSQYGYKS